MRVNVRDRTDDHWSARLATLWQNGLERKREASMLINEVLRLCKERYLIFRSTQIFS